MAAPNERYFWGDFRLYQHGYDHAEVPVRGQLLKFQGTDQKRALVIPASSNNELGLEVRCFAPPNSASKDRKGFRSILRAVRVALEDRSLRADPVVWVEDDSRSKVVGGYAAPTVTSVAHGFSNTDVVLVRRAGAGLFSLGVVSAVAADTFVITATGGTALHAIAAGDEIHLVEGWWSGMVYAGLDRIPPGEDDSWSDAAVYRFAGSGSSSYARTTASVGS